MGRREKLLGQLAEHLAKDEEVLDAMMGSYVYPFGAHPERGILAATSHRLVFFASRRKEYDFESFPYGTISSLEHGKKATGGTLKFRVPHATRATTLMPSFTTVTVLMIHPHPDLPSFVALIEGRMGEPSSTVIVQSATPRGPPDAHPAVSDEFIMNRTYERRFLIEIETGWEMRRRAGSRKSVPYRTLTRRRGQDGYEVSAGDSETWNLSMSNPLFCEMTDASGRRIATCEWGEFTKLGKSRMELRTSIIFPNGPNFELRIDGEKTHGAWWWTESLRLDGTVIADGGPGTFMRTYQPTPTTALLLWWAVHRRKTVPYLPPPSASSYGASYG